jgi:O-antigen/teichoic acid export membrane protein
VANPVLVKLLAEGSQPELARFCRRTGAIGFVAVAAVSAAVWGAFPQLSLWLPGQLVLQSRDLLLLLCAGLCVYAAFIPSDQILLQAGLPARQSALMAASLGANVVLNAILIPRYGAPGAAVATAAAYGCAALALNLAAARWLGLHWSVFYGRGVVRGHRPGGSGGAGGSSEASR